MRVTLAGSDPMADLRASLPGDFGKWAPEHKAAYLEMTTLLEPYLLSSQGERMAMAHGVEGRFPYLDHRLFEFAAALPPGSKLRGLREKDILRRWAESIIPKDVANRGKQPYRAPDAASFFGKDRPEYIDDLLDPLALAGTGFFDPKAVAGLIKRCEAGRATGFAENQSLVAILSTQLWYQQFCSDSSAHAQPTFGDADVRLQESVEYA
jgi:asparagine synthase (glutamine-hydrolysing)